MANYYDDAAGTRWTVTPKYFDGPLGSRRNLSGSFSWNGSGQTPTVPPTTGDANHILGMYPKVSDSTLKSALGQLPRLLSSYHQPAEIMGTAWVATEEARMKAGIHTCHLYASVKDTQSNPTLARDNVRAMLAGNPPAGLVNYMNQAQALSVKYPDVTQTIHFTGEVEVGINQSSPGSLSGGYGSLLADNGGDVTATFRDVGRYYQECFDLCDDLAPNVNRAFWMGGSMTGNNAANRNTFFSQITNPPTFVPGDPYNNQVNLSERPRDTWASWTNQWRSTTGVHRSHYVRWGEPPLALNETGIPWEKVSNHDPRYNDSQRAAWISQMYEDMVYLDLRHVIYFNSSGDYAQAIIPGTWPQSVAAFSGEITQDKQAAVAA